MRYEVALIASATFACFSMANGCFMCNFPNPFTLPWFPNPFAFFPPAVNGGGSCPKDALKLGVCSNILNGAVGAVAGSSPGVPCCTVLEGLLDLEAAICLCTAIKTNILGFNLDIPVSLNLIISSCGKMLPPEFTCP